MVTIKAKKVISQVHNYFALMNYLGKATSNTDKHTKLKIWEEINTIKRDYVSPYIEQIEK